MPSVGTLIGSSLRPSAATSQSTDGSPTSLNRASAKLYLPVRPVLSSTGAPPPTASRQGTPSRSHRSARPDRDHLVTESGPFCRLRESPERYLEWSRRVSPRRTACGSDHDSKQRAQNREPWPGCDARRAYSDLPMLSAPWLRASDSDDQTRVA